LPNVAEVTSPTRIEWIGDIDRFEDYASLLEWAVRCREVGEMVALREEFRARSINPFIL
jgi:hypothetical protein